MKTKFVTIALIAGALLISSVMPVRAQEPAPMDSAMAAMMAKWQEIKTPAAPHKKFAELVGKWSAAAKFWMDPSQPPGDMAGTAEFSLILGGRYLVQNLTSEWMGEPFHGQGITAFDNFRQEYVDIWMDDMGTGLYVSRGPKADGDVMTCHGTMDDPMTGRKDVPTRSVSTKIDNDSFRMEMFSTGPDGKEFKTMEVLYTRMK